MRSAILRALAGLSVFAMGLPAFAGTSAQGDAQKTLGAPYVDQLSLPSAASTIKIDLDRFHNLLEVLIVAITAFVFVLLGIVIVRFRRSANPVASRRTHNTPLEIIWTIIPVMIVAALLFPSTKLMYFMDKAKNPELTVKVTGHQWYWGYEYPDLGIDEYASNIIPDNKIGKGQIRLLSVDDPLVIPVDTEVQFLITGSDVIHSWYVPSFAINRSAMPGRTNEAWAKATHEGVFYGQCTKICGVNHGYMPIEVHVVSKDTFKAWAAAAKAGGVEKANAAFLGLRTASLDTGAPQDTSRHDTSLASNSTPIDHTTADQQK